MDKGGITNHYPDYCYKNIRIKINTKSLNISIGYKYIHMDNKITINETSLKITSLYRDNYLKELYVREIARLLELNHRTVLLNLNKLEKNNFLKSKTKGKNKYFHLNLENLATRDLISMTENYITIKFLSKVFLVKKLLSEIEREIKFDGILILFGSFAGGYATEESDIDILAIGEIDKEKIRKIGRTYGKDVNIKTSNLKNFEIALRKRDILVREVIKEHIILKNTDKFVDMLWRYFNEIR